ncbi:MAG: hypothetical protein Q4D61_04965 [Cardiobacteriaceae bacterium]|nr:hypothetical protein [Cardiobacteriaceae bacterium]
MKPLAALLTLAALPAFAQGVVLTPAEVEARYDAPGYAYGEHHCYGFATPPGWQMDNITARRLGVGMVFLPDGTTWENAPLAIYTRPFSREEGQSDDALIAAAVDSVKALYRDKSGIDIHAERVGNVQSDSGEQGELWHLRIPVSPERTAEEYVIYYPATGSANLFVIQIGSQSDPQSAEQALRTLAATYHRRSECQPCEETACRR